MKEIFRFVSVEKFDNLTEPCGKINIDDVSAQAAYYTKALVTKNQQELHDLIKTFFANSFNPAPLSINKHLTDLYEKIQNTSPLSADDIRAACRVISGQELGNFIDSPEYKTAKATILENLYFLVEGKNKASAKIKILYKRLLKLIGLLEAIQNNNPCLDKILTNPALQYYRFKAPRYEPPKKDDENKKEEEEIKKYKDQLIKQKEEILELKKAQNELLQQHQQIKLNLSSSTHTITLPQKNIGFLGRILGNSNSVKRLESTATTFKNPLLVKGGNLSHEAQKALKSIGVSNPEIEIFGTLNAINDAVINKSNQLNGKLNQPQYIRYGGKLLPAAQRFIHPRNINDLDRNEFAAWVNKKINQLLPERAPAAIPSGHGFAKVLGEGCLLRVEEEYLGCKLAHLSSVVNIPARSKKSYRDRYLTKTISSSESETEDTTFDETSSESKIQNNLSNEISKVQKFDMSLEAGLSVSANYGTVAVEASSKFSTNLGSSETKNNASSYAKDVTQRAIKRIEKRNRELIKAERTVENEIKNLEEYKNDSGNHAVGIYQWINEVYKAKLVQYDSRLLLEFMVPEPGNMLFYAAGNPVTEDEPTPPPAFNLTLNPAAEPPFVILDENNYLQYVDQWGAAGIDPPPSLYKMFSKSISGPDMTEMTKDYTALSPIAIKISDESLSIPEGYSVIYTKGIISFTDVITEQGAFHSEQGSIEVSLADWQQVIPNHVKDMEFYHYPEDEQIWNNIPVAVTGVQIRTFVLNVIACCKATQTAIDKWKIEALNKLRQAYQKQLDEYNDKLALSRQRSFLSGSLGNNPDKNRQIEKDELKRACISILTRQSFELFDSVNTPDEGFPTIRFGQVKPEGDYARFFETAFEWTQITYVLYPYFWANPEKTWRRSLNLKLDDPKHEEFMKSGFARVVIPVRPEFQTAILQYLDNGKIWDGENPDDIDWEHSMYVQIATEIMERQGHLEQAPMLKDEWEYELPTNHQVITNGIVLPAPPFI